MPGRQAMDRGRGEKKRFKGDSFGSPEWETLLD